MTQYMNISGYKFIPLQKIATLRVDLLKLAGQLDLKGTILLSYEGINITLAGLPDAIDEYKNMLMQDERFADINFKVSYSDFIPFSKMIIRLKEEIVTMGVKNIKAPSVPENTISPQELKQWYDEGKEFTILDTRNVYETKIGTFENAKLLPLENFRQFPALAKAMGDKEKTKPIVMYCTGGVRCEKAMPMLQELGFKEIYQLHGGIIKYLEECGGAHYQGECFVFDERIAVDATLKVTGTKLCSVCQVPVTQTEQVESNFEQTQQCLECISSSR